jgi:catechol 2,3-dioxygenase-like lactoylglutathione lyase family enzyme
MKRFHVHVSVPDMAQSIRFYSTLFGMEPAVVKNDYAKWMLEDPRLNFAISRRGEAPGIIHLGLQTQSNAELEELHGQLRAADVVAEAEQNVGCCYSVSNKYWVTDPTGIAWETFHTLGSIPTFSGTDHETSAETACCSPQPANTVAKIPAKNATTFCG